MYNLNINKSNIVQTNVIIGRIMDKPIDTLDFRIYNGHDPMDLSGCTLEFKGTTPDGNKVTSKSVKIVNAKQGDISFTVPENMYSSRGRFRNAYFTVTKNGRMDSTNDIIIDVLNAVNYTQEEANEIKDMLDEILKESQAKVDKYVNDAIKDSQAKLDKHLNESEAKVTAEMQKLQNSVANVNANMSALEKDVASFKVTMDKELARMQKQLDDLAKAINQTDIQRPQITQPNGEVIHVISDITKSTYELVKSLPLGVTSIYLREASDLPIIRGLVGIRQSINANTSGQIIASAFATGEMYSFTYNQDTSFGWRRLDNVNIVADSNLIREHSYIKPTPFGGSVIEITPNSTIPEFKIVDGYRCVIKRGSNPIVATIPLGEGNITRESVMGENYIHSMYIKNNSTNNSVYISNNASGEVEVKPNEYKFIQMSFKGNGQTHLQFNIKSYEDGANLDFTYHKPKIAKGEVFSEFSLNERDIALKSHVNDAILKTQVDKITSDSGGYIRAVDDVSKSVHDIAREVGSGMKYLYLINSKGQPTRYIVGILLNNTYSGGATFEGQFTGIAIPTGDMYTASWTTAGYSGWRIVTSSKV